MFRHTYYMQTSYDETWYVFIEKPKISLAWASVAEGFRLIGGTSTSTSLELWKTRNSENDI